MGQKANPISLRIHVNRHFESSWYQDTKYSNLLKQELQLKQYMKSLFHFMNVYEGRTLFQFFPKKVIIYSFITNKNLSLNQRERSQVKLSSNKRSQSNKKGNYLENVLPISNHTNVKINRSTKQEAIFLFMQHLLKVKNTKSLEVSNLQSTLFSYLISNTQLNTKNLLRPSLPSKSFYDNILLPVRKSTECVSSLHVVKLHSKYQSASFLAQYIAECFEKNIAFRQIYKQIQKEILRDSTILGLKIQCSGRINGAEIAKVESKKIGQTSLHTFSASVDFAKAEAYTLYGIIGIKVWISCTSHNKLLTGNEISAHN